MIFDKNDEIKNWKTEKLLLKDSNSRLRTHSPIWI
jgi:hypothetical protein